MGPNAILDKSAFQALSLGEHEEFERYFEENVTPVLILEILGDLSKTFGGGAIPAEKVRGLASKFGGTECLNEDYRFICVNTLLGFDVPLDGRIFPANLTVVDDKDGAAGLIEDGPLNHLVRRLASGQATTADSELAARWRSSSQGLSLRRLNEFVNANQIVVARAVSHAEAAATASALVDTMSLQDVWLSWLLSDLSVPPHMRRDIAVRWRHRGGVLRTFAPYAHHCLRALLTMFVAWRANIIHWQPTNLLDLQYLYYLPFCSVFVSDDKIHRALAPVLLRADQSFVPMMDFKLGLRHTHAHFERLSGPERAAARAKLFDWPPEGSIIRELWLKHPRWVGPPPPG